MFGFVRATGQHSRPGRCQRRATFHATHPTCICIVCACVLYALRNWLIERKDWAVAQWRTALGDNIIIVLKLKFGLDYLGLKSELDVKELALECISTGAFFVTLRTKQLENFSSTVHFITVLNELAFVIYIIETDIIILPVTNTI